MPRPGPRPYECVRRAWHSDRHQPIRGSLIQEIFRVVNEIHSSATKKNKEWQEKLPIVVLKAEEIMYSKANSEAEYMDLKTLWDRTNDAINTIIRRDESTETGALLQPCIEAALNLGCTPRRASRSQRNSDPRYYLSPSAPEPSYVSPGSLENTTKEDNITKSPYMSHCLNFLKPTNWNLTHSGSESQSPIALNNNCSTNKFPFASENVPIPTNNQCLPQKYYPASNLHSVYPLYYGNHFQVDVPITNHGFKILPKSNSSSLEPAKMIVVQNLFSCNLNASNQVTQTDIKDIVGNNQCEIECDLSLRLGPLSVPCVSVKNIHPQGVEDVASITSRQGSQFNDLSAQINKEFTFFRRSNVDDPLDSCSGKWSFVEGEHVNADATVRKRKAVLSHSLEDQQFCWQPKLPDNHLTGRMRHAGL